MEPRQYYIIEQAQAIISDMVKCLNNIPVASIIPNDKRENWLISAPVNSLQSSVDILLKDSMTTTIERGETYFLFAMPVRMISSSGKLQIPRTDDEMMMCDKERYMCLNCYKIETMTKFVSDRIFITKFSNGILDIYWTEFDGRTLQEV